MIHLPAAVIKEGNQVLLRKDDALRVFQVHSKRPVIFEKLKFTLDGLIGKPFGGSFEVKDGVLMPADLQPDIELDADVDNSGTDNRNLIGSGENQKLGQVDIQRLKDEGITGEQIIEQLIENSETFKSKTKYSQEKYINKKKKKHMQLVTALQPTARLLMEMYHRRGPTKICNLRIDSLSQILTYSNVMSGSNIAVVDSCQGLVIAAILQRLGGFGTVVNFYSGDCPSRQAVEYMDFPKEQMENLIDLPLSCMKSMHEKVDLYPAELKQDELSEDASISKRTLLVHGGSDTTIASSASLELDKSEPEDVSRIGRASGVNANYDAETLKDTIEDAGLDGDQRTELSDMVGGIQRKSKRRHHAVDQETREANRKRRNLQLNKAKELLQSQMFDGLIVACKFHPTPIVLELLKGVAPSRPVVVFCQHKEPLMDCWGAVREEGIAIRFKLSETWFRYYQVLPARTHPLNSMSGTGGYILTFITVSKASA